MKTKIVCTISLIVFYCLVGVISYQGGCRDTKLLMSKEPEKTSSSTGYASGYKDGIVKVIESLSCLEGAKVYQGGLNVSADNTEVNNCLFVYAEPLETAISVDGQDILIRDIAFYMGLAYPYEGE